MLACTTLFVKKKTTLLTEAKPLFKGNFSRFFINSLYQMFIIDRKQKICHQILNDKQVLSLTTVLFNWNLIDFTVYSSVRSGLIILRFEDCVLIN